MADLVSCGNANRDIQQALITLKKGSQLLKYDRNGKPKFCPFKLSSDESSLIWISGGGEKILKLASVYRIIPGQRTAVFQRYLCPEKDYLSFSLIYNNGKRSLDLICKDKVEVEVWIAGLQALITSGQGGRSKIDGWNDGGPYLDESSDITSNSPSDCLNSVNRDISSPEACANFNPNKSPKSTNPENSLLSERSYAVSNQTNMQGKGSSSDAFRASFSSAPSTSSHGSVPDEYEALGDVYIWGEVINDNVGKFAGEKNSNCVGLRTDVLLPRLLESNVVLDVVHIACGVRHAAIVTRQGDAFTWGEESGGRLGHGVRKDYIQPHLVESLAATNVYSVACGEFHSCAVTMDGELYTWGDGTHNAGLLGHGTDVSHWMPKRVAGPLEGLLVASVACGTWHTALVTSMGQLFTFGDGTFGVLGHGDRESVSCPREVESLSGLRTIAVACGVWHTAAAAEVIVTHSRTSVSSGKLFTWGDGDKNRLGQGDKDPRLKPTCVPALIDYNFRKISCGHSLTVGLTISGQVFTLGSPVYGQLGNPQADGKQPCLVGDELFGEAIEEVTCGAYHVAVLTSKNEVYTWGKGANGRLGHGDVEDRKAPTLVVALKDRHAKHIACGSNYTTAICLHKWVSGAEQAQCSACRQAFGFARKRHNCYNCGLVHCHSCSSKKAHSAALASNPSKLNRVCDSCYSKLIKVSDTNINNRRGAIPLLSGENKDRLEKGEIRLSKSVPSNMELIELLDNKAAKHGRKADTSSLGSSYQAPSILQLNEAVLATSIEFRRPALKLALMNSVVSSRSVSPFYRRPSPPRSATPVPTVSGLSFSNSMTDSLMKTNELMNQEVVKLRAQVERLKQKCELEELEIQKTVKKTQEALSLAAEESAKSKAAKEVIMSLTAQLKNLAERLPSGNYDLESMRVVHLPNGSDLNGTHHSDAIRERYSRSDSLTSISLASPRTSDAAYVSASVKGSQGQAHSSQEEPGTETTWQEEHAKFRLSNGGRGGPLSNGSVSEAVDENKERSNNADLAANSNQVEAEWIEQYEPGVYITLEALRDGTRDLKRVRFSRRRFGENQAENWWSENRKRVYEKYNIHGLDKSSVSRQHARRSDRPTSPSSSIPT